MKGTFCARAPINHSPFVSLLSFILSYKTVLHAFSLFYFKPLVTPLIIQFFFNNIYVGSKNEGANLMKAVQFFDFLFSNNVMNGLKEKKEKKHVKQIYMVK